MLMWWRTKGERRATCLVGSNVLGMSRTVMTYGGNADRGGLEARRIENA